MKMLSNSRIRCSCVNILAKQKEKALCVVICTRYSNHMAAYTCTSVTYGESIDNVSYRTSGTSTVKTNYCRTVEQLLMYSIPDTQ